MESDYVTEAPTKRVVKPVLSVLLCCYVAKKANEEAHQENKAVMDHLNIPHSIHR